MKRPNFIQILFEQGAIAYSLVKSQQDRIILDNLQSLELVRIDVYNNKRKVIVVDQTQFSTWVMKQYPVDKSQNHNLANRAQNIMNSGNSKAGKTTHIIQPVLLKWFTLDLSSPYLQWTQEFGIIGVVSNQIKNLQFPERWNLLTVENWESFYSLKYAIVETPIVAAYLGGNVSDVVLFAFSQINPKPERILHFGDYDWAGLKIFQRVQTILPKAKLYIPSNIEELLKKNYGNHKLVKYQLMNVDFNNPEIQPVIDLIAHYNMGLEQEILEQPSEDDFSC